MAGATPIRGLMLPVSARDDLFVDLSASLKRNFDADKAIWQRHISTAVPAARIRPGTWLDVVTTS